MIRVMSVCEIVETTYRIRFVPQTQCGNAFLTVFEPVIDPEIALRVIKRRNSLLPGLDHACDGSGHPSPDPTMYSMGQDYG